MDFPPEFFARAKDEHSQMPELFAISQKARAEIGFLARVFSLARKNSGGKWIFHPSFLAPPKKLGRKNPKSEKARAENVFSARAFLFSARVFLISARAFWFSQKARAKKLGQKKLGHEKLGRKINFRPSFFISRPSFFKSSPGFFGSAGKPAGRSRKTRVENQNPPEFFAPRKKARVDFEKSDLHQGGGPGNRVPRPTK